MAHKSELNHVALLVKSVDKAAERFSALNFEVGAVEQFDSEGTREIYVGEKASVPRVLLMEAIGNGPYQRAFEKRGPGLHHICINVTELEKYVLSLSGSGWFVHPGSVSMLKSGTVWLARPGVSALIEVHERKSLLAAAADSEAAYAIQRLELNIEPKLLSALGCERLVAAKAAQLIFKDVSVSLGELF